MFYWSDKDWQTAGVFPTTLDKAIEKIVTANGNDYNLVKANVKYYDFEHPEATHLTVIIDGVCCGGNSEQFSLLVPHEISLYDATVSFAYLGYNTGGWVRTSYEIDGKSIFTGGGGTYVERFSVVDYLTRDITHWLKANYIYNGNVGHALVLLYSLPPQ